MLLLEREVYHDFPDELPPAILAGCLDDSSVVSQK
jgi:hypothetical protein